MIHMDDKKVVETGKQVLALIIVLILLSAFFPTAAGYAEETANDPIFYQADDPIPVITSVGKENVSVHGIKSKNKLVKYTIPEQVLASAPDFLSMMIVAETCIGYPYVYGGGSPDTGFDCSGFVCWVLNQSGVLKTKRLGANGLYSICTDIPRDQARPGDLVFFEKTMGADVKGITHVGIYVGNNMMIHAGDPVGFADLQSDQWAKKLYGFGRLN